jgi:predicted acyl esterase
MADDVQWAFRVIEHTWIPMADGVRLSARLWIPEDCSPLPPALMATIAIAGTDHRYLDDAHYIGGLYGRANLEWGVLCKSVLASPPDPEIVGEDWLGLWQQRLESSQALIGNWSSHQNFDSYWQRGSAALDYPAIACPVYVVAGLLDTYVNPVGRMLAELPGPSKGLVGCWGHTYPDTAAPKRGSVAQ